MSRTKIASDLIHPPLAEFQTDAERLDALCDLISSIAAPVVEHALFREAAESATDVTTLEETQEVLKEVLDLDAEEYRTLAEGLKTFFASDPRKVLFPDKSEVLEHTHDLSRMMTSAWIEILRRDLSHSDRRVLSGRLLPESEDIRPWELLKKAVSSFAVNEDDVTAIMQGLRQKVVSEESPVALPFNIVLEQRSGQPILVRSSPQVLAKYEKLRDIRNEVAHQMPKLTP